MKKISYNTKSREELQTELKSLRATIQAAIAKSRQGKNSKDYVVARKNVARVLTALNALPKESPEKAPSTEAEK